MAREFDFLPELPKPDLDDRAFQDLVNECLLRIPRYCPEWTNYNPSDPGITLIELFAWLTDQMLVRFNEVPRLNYINFLELLGINRQAPTPAKTEVTFYLSASLTEDYTINAGTEVATERTEGEEAIIFATDTNLVIGQPRIRHLLTADRTENQPQVLRDRFSGSWRLEPNGEWRSILPLGVFEEQPNPGNCFYLVFEPEDILEGNVIALTIKAEAATPTGIKPEQPPRRWEAWNGEKWEPILLEETDDGTEGLSFSKFSREGGNPQTTGSEIKLHLPLQIPVANFVTYQGRWIRCIYTQASANNRYDRSPRIVALAARAIGGTVRATQSTLIENEILGESDGNPTQTFYLQRTPILPRRQEHPYREYIEVTPPGGTPQTWQEVTDFASSTENSSHYTLDSITGRIQFGPLIREPAQIKELTTFRQRLQRETNTSTLETMSDEQPQSLKRQYGKVPPRGATIRMVAYRTGGGQQGNVQKKTIKILKSAVPYIAKVENHKPGRNGTDAESLEAAVIRVPQMLRTRDRAVTAEDFETLAIAAGQGAIARARCLSPRNDEPGQVRLLLVPHANTDTLDQGIAPEQFNLNLPLREQVAAYLDERRLLGVKVKYEQPEYVGVSVQAAVALDPEYNNNSAKQKIQSQLLAALYRFLNPITGGNDGKGWSFGRSVYPSDIVRLFQMVPGVRYIGTIQLFALRHTQSGWERSPEPLPEINPGQYGLVCSWNDFQWHSGHVISILNS